MITHAAASTTVVWKSGQTTHSTEWKNRMTTVLHDVLEFKSRDITEINYFLAIDDAT